MSGSDWDSYSEPSEKRAIPFWGKFIIGIGVVALLLVGSCVGVTFWAAKTGKMTKFFAEKMSSVIEKLWGRVLAVTDAVQTDEGASRLYQENPALMNDYPTEEDFLKNAATWRPKVANLPRTSPSLMALGKSGFQVRRSRNQENLFEISYNISDETKIRLCWEDDKLVELKIQ